ncbi:hypothetical protein KGM_203029 [Danaus plexippus plexippus]|uniref:Uncharacterized protein n=1 Tax=Danaus plexippus plexippus TaxID=278856 RepID=A0A212EKH6_DANPL|nr:hypothetical protein KGM_203029 [Danaus plexippus plexippus]
MRSLRILRCRKCSPRVLLLLLLVVAFIVYCYYYTLSPIHPKPSKYAPEDALQLKAVMRKRARSGQAFDERN